MIKWQRGEPVWEVGRAKWKQIADTIRERIVSGVYRPEFPLPSMTHLEQEFGVTRNTLRKSMRLLSDEGLIYVELGVGTFVKRPEDEVE